ncbi:macro domain-containing protein [Pseudokineococcus basanitobsidens]|uniref:Macro domain-containing protein n=1 Tax=Pseudokineococcus basanitobsidens TaxID=1926649 RepID=A0ABU8RP19_9ACTN
MRIEVVRGDVTQQPVDAVVTAANQALKGGGGVDAAVHRAAGPELVRASRALAPCPTGQAVVTPAFDLAPVRWVVHAVGPRYRGRPQDADLLASAYTAALACADGVGARSVAFPAISTGVYGYPDEEAARVSVAALRGASTDVERVLLVAFGDRQERLWHAALG